MKSGKQDQNKARERRHIECLRKCYASFPAGIITPGESPDFTVRTDTGAIGIEHRELFLDGALGRGSEQRAKDGEREKAIVNARRIYARKPELPCVEVLFFWNENYALTSRRRKEIEGELATFVEQNLPVENSSVSIEQTGLRGSPLPLELDRVRIARFECSEWNFVPIGYVATLDLGYLTGAIAEKEHKIKSYQGGVDQVWLALVIEGFRASSFLEVPANIGTSVFETSFDKILLLRFFEGEVVELHSRKIYDAEPADRADG